MPQTLSKIDDKYQDLFASILFLMSRTCIFDISSKYLRHNELKHQSKNNYAIMGELRKVFIQAIGNKMEIQDKIPMDDNMIVE